MTADHPATPLLDRVAGPAGLRGFSDTQLRQLADELRAETISAVSVTGGHLGAGLGVVELTVALHAVFDTPSDRLIGDVGHQCYPHKILTGRRERIRTLRRGGGLSGFTRRRESACDPFGAAHSSTSISAALGFAVARDLGARAEPPAGAVIAVIGDGALSAGMAYEAMNNVGHLGTRMFVILNDNEMSIAPPVGAMANYLAKLYAGAPFQDLKAAARGAVSLVPAPLPEGARRAREMLKSMPVGGTLFEEPGFSDVGPIDGQHAVTFSAGMAAGGLKPFCAIYSTFLQRGYDQVVHDVAIQRLPVRFAIDRAGLVGADGATHAGSFDIAFLANLPDFAVMAAADESELVHMVATAAAIDDRPSAFRFPRGDGAGAGMPERGIPLEIGRGRIIRDGGRAAILNFGARMSECLKAAESLAQRGKDPTVADARFAKPLDHDLIRQLARHHEVLIAIKEGAIGGFGSRVGHFLAESGLLDGGLKFRSMFLPDTFLDHDPPAKMYAAAAVNAPEIESRVLEIIGASKIAAKRA